MKYLIAVTLALLTLTCQSPTLPPAEPPTVTVEAPTPAYDRGEWGRWRDADKDCQDTRQEVLIAESTEPVVMDEKGCRVLSGRWLCRYTGNEYTDPSKLDIDHMVPLKAAYDAGGSAWDRERKRAYFNDLGYAHHLVAVSASANRSKGAKTPLEWVPKSEHIHCDYLRVWMTVKANWKLAVTCEESGRIAMMMATVCDDNWPPSSSL